MGQSLPPKPRSKGGSKKKAKITLPSYSDPILSHPRPPPPPPPLPPPPRFVFHAYPSPSSTSSTPLPPPSMPRKPFFRRIMPLLFVGSGAYALMRNLAKQSAVKDENVVPEVSSVPVESSETTVPE